MSIFIAALLVFAAINVIFQVADARLAISSKTQNENYFDFPGLRKISAKKRGDKLQVLLLGSSLFVHPLRYLDKRMGEEKGLHCANFSYYHATAHLNEKLSCVQGQFNEVCTLAVGGAMISDYYLLLNKYINSNPFPQVVIVDCAPRSFYDSGLTMASDTPIFNYFFDGRDLFRLSNLYLPDAAQRLDFIVKYLCPLSKHRRAIAIALTDKAKGLMPLPAKQGGEIANQPIKGVEDYATRYNGISLEKIEPQMHFLDRLVQLCAGKHARLLLLNMPLTGRNKKLLPAEFYSAFKHKIELCAQKGKATFLDFDSNGEFIESDFDDSVHLGVSGGEKLENKFVEFIQNKQVIADRCGKVY